MALADAVTHRAGDTLKPVVGWEPLILHGENLVRPLITRRDRGALYLHLPASRPNWGIRLAVNQANLGVVCRTPRSQARSNKVTEKWKTRKNCTTRLRGKSMQPPSPRNPSDDALLLTWGTVD